MMGCPVVCRLPLQLYRMQSAIASFPVQPHSARALIGDAHFFHALTHAVPVSNASISSCRGPRWISVFSRRIRSTCASRSAYLGYQISWHTITWVTGSASQEPANLDISSSLLWSTVHGPIWANLTTPDRCRAEVDS